MAYRPHGTVRQPLGDNMIQRCAKCGHRTSDYVKVTNGLVTLALCKDDAPTAWIPANARLVTVTAGTR